MAEGGGNISIQESNDGVFIANSCKQLCMYECTHIYHCTSFPCYIEFYMNMNLDMNLDEFGAVPNGRHNMFKCFMCAPTYSASFTTCYLCNSPRICCEPIANLTSL